MKACLRISAGMGATLALLTGANYAHLLADRLSAYCGERIRRQPLTLAATMLAPALLFDTARAFYVISSANYLSDNIQRSNLVNF